VAERIGIGLVYPELLGTYGDRGNAELLVWRAARHGLAAEVIAVPAGEPVPPWLDLYVLGGGEDAAQATAARLLRSAAGDGLRRAADQGRVVLAVCGAFQLLGRVYLDGQGREIPGLGLLDLETAAGTPRLVGEVVTMTREGELLTGFENHGGRSVLGPGLQPLGRVLHGGGNNGRDTTEGARQGAVVGTYLHGPVLARNPALADLLLRQALQRRGRQLGPLQPAGRDPADDLHLARLQAVLPQHRPLR
jgi:CobQ-like glutamine amidotransferase family enzyme